MFSSQGSPWLENICDDSGPQEEENTKKTKTLTLKATFSIIHMLILG